MSEIQLTPSSAAHWRAIGQYTAAQAASLMLGLEPQGERIKDASPKAQALADRIAERFKLREPGPVIKRRKSTWYRDDSDAEPAGHQPPSATRSKISLADLERFAYAHELTDSPLFGKSAADDEPAEDETPDAPQSGRKAEPAMLKAQSYALALMLYRKTERDQAIEQAVLKYYASANESAKKSKRSTLKRRLNELRKEVSELGEIGE